MLRSKLNRTILPTALILLSGCATTVSNCPPLKQYSKEFSIGLAGEVEKAGPYTIQAISDYYVLRRQVSACQGSGTHGSGAS